MASLQSSESHLPQLLTIADSNSSEFEFWNNLRNPSFPQPNLLSADELFADGVVLPLHRLQIHFHEPPDDPIPPPDYTEPSSVLAASKRWRDIFKKTDKKSNPNSGRDKTKKEKSITGGGNSSAELNINIWPFSRSRSAGTGGNRTKTAAVVVRKVSSAPCSRSNSRGESNSKGRKLPSSPSRGGVHLGRSSPVLQIRRGGSGRKGSDPNSMNRLGQKGSGSGSSPRLANMDYRRNNPTCGGDEKIGGVNGAGAVDGGGRSSGSQLFNLRSLFSKKVY